MIKTVGLIKRFDEYTCLKYADLSFNDGESYVMLGASGCGKSTYLNLLAGVISPTAGDVIINGENMSAQTQKARDAFRVANIGYVFQDFRLIEEMSVEDNINILKLEGVDTSRAGEVLETLGIARHRRKRVCLLSGGEKQRVAIARALVKQPGIILADEPTGNLNYAIGRDVMQALIDAAQGHTLICVTHDDRLSGMFDHVIDMNAIVSPVNAEEYKNV